MNLSREIHKVNLRTSSQSELRVKTMKEFSTFVENKPSFSTRVENKSFIENERALHQR